jgi:hypothetical protein
LAAAFVLACAAVVAVLGALFAGQSQPDRLDAAVGHWLRFTSWPISVDLRWSPR